MVDAHVHIERGPYTREWILRFAQAARAAGLDGLCLLEHSHRFVEFAPLYEGVAAYSPYQAEWLSRRMVARLGDYLDLVDASRGEDFPVEMSWGLEVCWVPEKADFLRQALAGLGLDFLTGSVHWIDGWGFDHARDQWEGRDVDALWARYYEIMEGLAGSGLFDRLAHPDSLKCFGFLPRARLAAEEGLLASTAARQGILVEVSAGLNNNYDVSGLGMEPGLFRAFAEAGASFIAASDAHRPEDVGRGVAECSGLIETVSAGPRRG